MKPIEEIKYKGRLKAIIIRSSYQAEGVNFITPPESDMQLAVMKHNKGRQIKPHVHPKVERHVHTTNEVLIVKSGKLKVNLYEESNVFYSEILSGGDLILLIEGGHGFEVIEDLQMIEVKQGPFLGDNDKRMIKEVPV